MEQFQSGDVVVSHVNGTRDLFIIATVVSTVRDLTPHCVSTMTGEDAAILGGYERLEAVKACGCLADLPPRTSRRRLSNG
jgi:hypothetical protein